MIISLFNDVNSSLFEVFEIVKSKSKDNPVFYIQYAYARCMSLIAIYEKIFNSYKDFYDKYPKS